MPRELRRVFIRKLRRIVLHSREFLIDKMASPVIEVFDFMKLERVFFGKLVAARGKDFAFGAKFLHEPASEPRRRVELGATRM